MKNCYLGLNDFLSFLLTLTVSLLHHPYAKHLPLAETSIVIKTVLQLSRRKLCGCYRPKKQLFGLQKLAF